jgi:hypothetical protein
VRLASWLFVLCMLAAAIGFFVPALELQLGGASISKRTSRSLYQVHEDREFMRHALSAYRGTRARGAAESALKKLGKKIPARLRDPLGDVQDAMDTLDGVNDADVRHADTALAISIFGYCALAGLAALLVFLEAVAGTYRKRRLYAACGFAVILAIAGIAVHVGLRAVAAELNDDLVPVFGLRGGAYLIPIAAVGGLVAAIVNAVLARQNGKSSSPPPPPPPVVAPVPKP